MCSGIISLDAYYFTNILVSGCGHCDCPTTLFFEEVDGLEKTFFVNEPANIGCECLLECSDYEYGGETYIATCENSRVDMGKYFHGLVGTNSLLLQHTFEDESYTMHKG